jgi:RNA polymerase sigma-70 factor (ECF subfamily)
MRLVRALRGGDHERTERWVRQQYPRVYRMLRYLTGCREVAEDLTQQAFVQAWQALPTFRGEAKLETWLHRIAYHQYTHWLRDRRSTASLAEAADVEDPRYADGLTTILVKRALDSLSQEMREAFLLFYARQMSIKEIAAVLDIPAGTVKSRLFAARRALRELLTERPAPSGQPESVGEDARLEALR